MIKCTLGSRKYTTQIDIWALGCVFAELLIGKSHALFPAQKTPDQFEIICEKCGTPDESQWPGYKSLPFYANMIPRKNHPRTLMQYMRKQRTNVDSAALDLLDRMLTINPDDRITAKEALEHQYFKSDPLPCELSEMPKIEKDCHAFVLNAERKGINLNKPDANPKGDNNPKKNMPQQNRNYNQNRGGGGYNNPNQSHHTSRQSNYNNPNQNYRHNNPRNSSTTHGNTHRHDHSKDSKGSHHNTSSEKNSQKPNYSIIPQNEPSKETTLSSNLTSLFKTETISGNTVTV